MYAYVGAIVGNSAIVSTDHESTCSCKLSILRAKNEGMLPEMLLVFIKTRFGQNQIQKFKRGAAQTGLLLEDFSQLFIPKFSNEMQTGIKQLVDAIYKINVISNEKYSEAEDLLLSKIGMNKYVHSTVSISEKFLSESFIETGRIDSEYYLPKYDELFSKLFQFSTKPLGQIVTFKKSIEPGSEFYGDTGIPFIRVSNISKYGISEPEIKLPIRVVDDVQSLYPQKDTILFSKDGSVGIAYKVERNSKFITSSALLHLKVKEKEVLPDYLTLVLNSIIVQMQAERDTNGAIIQHWNKKDIEKVVIPILDEPVQEQISQKVKESFALRHRSEDLLEIAMRAVEIAIEQGEEQAIAWIREKGVER